VPLLAASATPNSTIRFLIICLPDFLANCHEHPVSAATHAVLPGSTVLLDTHVVLWSLADDSQLGPRARSLIEDNTIMKFVSAASIWEMEVEAQLGRLDIPDDIAGLLLSTGVMPLSIFLVPREKRRCAPSPS
jgi:hypothetical protein